MYSFHQLRTSLSLVNKSSKKYILDIFLPWLTVMQSFLTGRSRHILTIFWLLPIVDTSNKGLNSNSQYTWCHTGVP